MHMLTFNNQLVEPRFTVPGSGPKPVFKIQFKCRDHELQVRLSYLENTSEGKSKSLFFFHLDLLATSLN